MSTLVYLSCSFGGKVSYMALRGRRIFHKMGSRIIDTTGHYR